MATGKSRVQIVDSLLQRIMESKDFPAFSEHIDEVKQMAEDEESTMRHITNVILKDVSLTRKVLQTANSMHYNRSGKGIVTVTHAVALLGLDAVRDLASTMMLFHDFWGRNANQKRLLQFSLLTAAQSRVTATRLDFPHVEEAYLCGMFRNLGELLVAGYMPRKYAAILKRRTEFDTNERAACLRVMECTYEELGQAATRHWKMPDRVRHCMQPERAQIKRTVLSDLDVLRAITSFSHGLTETVHRTDRREAPDRLNFLLQTYGPILSLNRPAMQHIAEEAIEETRSTFELLDIPMDVVPLQQQTESVMAALDEVDPLHDLPESPEEDVAGGRLLERLTEEVELVLCSRENSDVNQVLLMIIEAMFRGGPFDRVLFGLVTPDHKSVRGRLGLGESIETFLEAFDFPLSIRSGPVAIALLGRRDVLVNDNRYAQTFFGEVVESNNFGLMPVVVHSLPVGIFYFDRKPGEPPPDPETIYQLARLKSLAVEAIHMSQFGPETET